MLCRTKANVESFVERKLMWDLFMAKSKAACNDLSAKRSIFLFLCKMVKDAASITLRRNDQASDEDVAKRAERIDYGDRMQV